MLSIPIPTSEEPHVLDKLREYGNLRVYTGEDDARIICLPTQDVPTRFLDPKNWRLMRHERGKRQVRQLLDPKDTADFELYMKPLDPTCAQASRIFPELRKQVQWECIFLLELFRQRIRAEIPEALVRFPSGEEWLMVRGIKKSEIGTWASAFEGKSQKNAHDERRQMLKTIEDKTPLIPEPSDAYWNFVTDNEGNEWIIDVEAWGMKNEREQFAVLYSKLLANMSAGLRDNLKDKDEENSIVK